MDNQELRSRIQQRKSKPVQTPKQKQEDTLSSFDLLEFISVDDPNETIHECNKAIKKMFCSQELSPDRSVEIMQHYNKVIKIECRKDGLLFEIQQKSFEALVVAWKKKDLSADEIRLLRKKLRQKETGIERLKEENKRLTQEIDKTRVLAQKHKQEAEQAEKQKIISVSFPQTIAEYLELLGEKEKIKVTESYTSAIPQSLGAFVKKECQNLDAPCLIKKVLRQLEGKARLQDIFAAVACLDESPENRNQTFQALVQWLDFGASQGYWLSLGFDWLYELQDWKASTEGKLQTRQKYPQKPLDDDFIFSKFMVSGVDGIAAPISKVKEKRMQVGSVKFGWDRQTLFYFVKDAKHLIFQYESEIYRACKWMGKNYQHRSNIYSLGQDLLQSKGKASSLERYVIQANRYQKEIDRLNKLIYKAYQYSDFIQKELTKHPSFKEDSIIKIEKECKIHEWIANFKFEERLPELPFLPVFDFSRDWEEIYCDRIFNLLQKTKRAMTVEEIVPCVVGDRYLELIKEHPLIKHQLQKDFGGIFSKGEMAKYWQKVAPLTYFKK